MIESPDKYLGAMILKPVQSPALYKYRPKLTDKYSQPLLKGITHPKQPQLQNHSNLSSPNKSFLSSPEASIEQIKGKIQEYLTFNSETSPLTKYPSELFS